MFAHQVIEDLAQSTTELRCTLERFKIQMTTPKAVLAGMSDMITLNSMEILTKRIKSAQKFHLGLQTNAKCQTGPPRGHLGRGPGGG